MGNKQRDRAPGVASRELFLNKDGGKRTQGMAPNQEQRRALGVDCEKNAASRFSYFHKFTNIKWFRTLILLII